MLDVESCIHEAKVHYTEKNTHSQTQRAFSQEFCAQRECRVEITVQTRTSIEPREIQHSQKSIWNCLR